MSEPIDTEELRRLHTHSDSWFGDDWRWEVGAWVTDAADEIDRLRLALTAAAPTENDTDIEIPEAADDLTYEESGGWGTGWHAGYLKALANVAALSASPAEPEPREVARLRAMVDAWDLFYDECFPDDPFTRGLVHAEVDRLAARPVPVVRSQLEPFSEAEAEEILARHTGDAFRRPPGTGLPTAPEGCEVNPVSSRMCERGTKSCTATHAVPATPTDEPTGPSAEPCISDDGQHVFGWRRNVCERCGLRRPAQAAPDPDTTP